MIVSSPLSAARAARGPPAAPNSSIRPGASGSQTWGIRQRSTARKDLAALARRGVLVVAGGHDRAYRPNHAVASDLDGRCPQCARTFEDCRCTSTGGDAA
ncbi:hypothetical protein ACMA1D_02150 [Streptomyces sp. 796.1]|uniref:hypothetical protein n=1 Tax=Streptomyces sp. 796.1 TaxID=3163029 RepID=UPI0039C8E846